MAATGFASALPWQGLPAPCQLLPAALAVGSSRAGAWVSRDHQVSSGQCRYSTERGRSRAGHTGSPHIASSSGRPNSSVSQADANQSLAALVPGAETLLAVVAPEVLAGAVCSSLPGLPKSRGKSHSIPEPPGPRLPGQGSCQQLHS